MAGPTEPGPLWARVASTLGHPALLLPAAILLAAGRAGALTANREPIIAICLAMAAVAAYLAWGTRTGRWAHIDVPLREGRRPMYRFVLALVVALLLLSWALTGSGGGPFSRGLLCVLGLLAAAALLNRWLKVSLHTALACYSVGIVYGAGAGWFLAWALMASAVAVSRLFLGRHQVSEVAAGAALGAIFGLLLHVPIGSISGP